MSAEKSKHAIDSSRGRLCIELDKSLEQESSSLMALPDDERRQCVKAIMHYVETSRKTKPMRPFETYAKAFKAQFKKIGRITKNGEKWQHDGYLKFPESETALKENALYVEDISNKETEYISLSYFESAYRKIDNPLAAFNLFLTCYKAGVYPPPDLMKWFAEKIEKYKTSNYQDSLNIVFGIDNPGKGKNKNNAVKEAKRMSTEFHELCRMAALIDYFDLTVEDAAEFMSQTGKSESASAYVSKYYGEWNNLLSKNDLYRAWYEMLVVNRSGKVADYQKLSFLDKIGRFNKKDALPANIEKFLKKNKRL